MNITIPQRVSGLVFRMCVISIGLIFGIASPFLLAQTNLRGARAC